jgi:hypothetical protein
MKRFILLSFTLITSLGADTLAFGSQDTSTQPSRSYQSLQLSATKTMEAALAVLQKVPVYYRHHVGIYQNAERYVIRYQNEKFPRILPWISRDFKKAGFKDAFIVPSTTAAPLQLAANTPPSAPLQKEEPSMPVREDIREPVPTLSQHDQTRLILDAQRAYEQRDFTQATVYYEMMNAAGLKDRQILLNLAYLYGREGSFALLEKKIEGKRGVDDYLYAYSIGALEAGRSDLYTSLSPHLMYDKSGRLAMVCGYFFEQEKNPERAHTFYKMAYNAAPSNPHILYAYARSADIRGEREQALYLYTQLTELGSEFESLRLIAQTRIQILRRRQ